MPFGLYVILIIFNSILTILVCPGFFRKWKELRNKMLFYRLVATGFAIVWFWIIILYQTIVYIT
ncbi:hypothetical protein DES34_10761 [Brevibacillus brevis]|jgi:hypothetical protein|uniref:hypothetical protein n=1 Tax=Brevibacillus brevis TaxID=1393 RepID=UPI000D101D58|nr:hypothetical protein C7J99_00905 [Brevibacillus brevis]RED28712.1 hypothetical protein DES34_10761 [Brevibacillus brevis]GEC89716.1 hypothetical protein BBR01nite_20470 [Brevibacillus brevis]VEF91693.1 Uncharacterised protein [Brevibacillus brevis]